MSEYPDSAWAETCPACGADVGVPCRTVIDGVDTGWSHDRRILAPVLRGIARGEHLTTPDPATPTRADQGDSA